MNGGDFVTKLYLGKKPFKGLTEAEKDQEACKILTLLYTIWLREHGEELVAIKITKKKVAE